MRLFSTAIVFTALAATPVLAADTIRIELNALEPKQASCLVSFVVENKRPAAVDSLKLDLATFNADGVIHRRLIVELGPLPRAKTMVKAFELDGECAQVSALLVNDVAACTPLEQAACLDELALSSKAKGVRFYK